MFKSLQSGTGFDDIKGNGDHLRLGTVSYQKRPVSKVQVQFQLNPRIEEVIGSSWFLRSWKNLDIWREPRRGCWRYSPNEMEIPIFWKCQCHGMATKESRSWDIEQAWDYETIFVCYRGQGQSSPLGPSEPIISCLDPRSQLYSFLYCWSLFLFWFDFTVLWLFSFGERR